ncbi:MAG: ABC transporter permease [archaeon]
MWFDYLRLASGNLLHKRLRSWLTMIGIFIGIATVVALISLGQGMKQAISQQFLSLGTDKLIVTAASTGFAPPGSLAAGKLTTHDVSIIDHVSGVNIVTGRLLRSVKLEYDHVVRYQYAVSTPKDKKAFDLVTEANKYVIGKGRWYRLGEKALVVGSGFAKDVFDADIHVGTKVDVQGQAFTVVGILESSGNPERDDALAIDEEVMRELLNIRETYDMVAVSVNQGEDMNKVSEDIQRAMRKDRNQKLGQEDFVVQTPQQLIETFNTILDVVNGVLIGIAAISLIVGGVGITNTMYTSVLQRTRDIGVMKAIGARRRDILAIFLTEAGLLGMLGGAIGIALGIGFAKLVEIIAASALGSGIIQVYFPWYLVLGALLFSFGIGCVAGITPALQAAKMHPVDALRYEL